MSHTPNLSVRPTSDVLLVWSGPPTARIVDIAFASRTDQSLVRGPAKLAQDVVLWITSRVGSRLLDPGWGNPLFDQLGQAMPSDTSAIEDVVLAAEDYFLQTQARAAAAGYVALDEQLLSIDGTQVSVGPSGTILVGFTVHTRAGIAFPVSTALAA